MSSTNWPKLPGTNSQPSPGDRLCNDCHRLPNYIENGRIYPYCGRACAKAATPQGQSDPVAPAPATPKACPPYTDDEVDDASDAERRSEDDEYDDSAETSFEDDQEDDLAATSSWDDDEEDFCTKDGTKTGAARRPASGYGLTTGDVGLDLESNEAEWDKENVDEGSQWDEDDMDNDSESDEDETNDDSGSGEDSPDNAGDAGDIDSADRKAGTPVLMATAAPIAYYTTNDCQDGDPTEGGNCMLCCRPCYADHRTGKVSEYCTKGHRREAVTRGVVDPCVYCKYWPQAKIKLDTRSSFCTRSHARIVLNTAPVVLELGHQSEAYKSVEHQFMTNWLHPTNKPRVLRVLQVFEHRNLFDEYHRYRARIDELRGGRLPCRPFGNEQRRWHGTNRQCRLGDPGQSLKFCNSHGCSLCMICKTSFKITNAGKVNTWGRFGRGIYLSSTSSKSHDYVKNQAAPPKAGATKAMLLARVVCGKIMSCKANQTMLTQPPPGYDCVVGQPVPGSSVNYDEVVVYTDDAVRPAYVIIYQ